MLVTSRAPLHLSGEHEFAVPPLALPDAHGRARWRRCTQSEAGALFVARATALQRDGAITAATAPAVAEICARLDGLPLAIELAAARSTLLAPEALLARLEHRLALLTGGARDLPARQQTLRATIDWSYQLLDAGGAALFARLAVFVGGWTLEAAEAICAGSGDGGVTVLDGLQALVDQQLVRHDDRRRHAALSHAGDDPRVRAGAVRHRADAEAVEGRYAAYYLALAEAAEAGLGGPEQVAWLDDLEREHGNLRAAFQWALARGEAELCLRLASAQRQFWYCSGHVREGIGALEAALALQARSPPECVRRALLAAAWLLIWARNQARAQDYSTEALALLEASGDRRGIANALLSLDRAAEALALFQQLGDKRGIAQALWMLELHASRTGDGALTSQRHAQALALFRELGDTAEMAAVLGEMGSLARDQGDYARAERLFAEELELARQVRDINWIAWIYLASGELALLQGDYAAARARLEQSVECFAAGATSWRRVCAVQPRVCGAARGRRRAHGGVFQREPAALPADANSAWEWPRHRGHGGRRRRAGAGGARRAAVRGGSSPATGARGLSRCSPPHRNSPQYRGGRRSGWMQRHGAHAGRKDRR